jgi:hypothetical protein
MVEAMDGGTRSRLAQMRARTGPRLAWRAAALVAAAAAAAAGAVALGAAGGAYASPGALARAQRDGLLAVSGELTSAALPAGKLGYSVALSADGSTALVGAPGAEGGAGAALVFVRTGAGWTQQGAPLTVAEVGPSGASACAESGVEPEECRVGRSVALSADGDTALIGAPHASGRCGTLGHECANQGAAYVFTRSGSTWSRQAVITGTKETAEARFGHSVALSADGATALVGAPADEGGGGAAFVFVREGSSWSEQSPKLVGGGEEVGEGHLGGSVALSADGRTAVVGAPGDDGYVGGVWPFVRSGSTWSRHGAKLTGGLEEAGVGHFGFSVALSADGATALVGARADAEDTGAAWSYARTDVGWAQLGGKLVAGAGEIGPGEFGYALAISADGSAALIGAPRNHAFVGAAWLLQRSDPAWGPPSRLEPSGESGRGWYGASAALSADGAGALVGGPIDSAKNGAVWTFAPAPPASAPGEPGPGGNSPGGAAPGGSAPGSSVPGVGVLGFGPVSSAAILSCNVSLRSHVAVVSRGRATVRLRGVGNERVCAGSLALAVRQRTLGGHLRWRRIAVASVSIAIGSNTVLRMIIGAAGRSMLDAARGRLSASLLFTPAHSSAPAVSVGTVRLSVSGRRPSSASR